MKVVILAGGLGTRLAEYTENIPKPLVKIGSMPIIWHIMKIYSQYGYNEFVLPLGYKGELVKEFFLNYSHTQNDIEIDRYWIKYDDRWQIIEIKRIFK